MKNRPLYSCLFLIVLTSAVYYPSLDNSFQYDDGHTIVNNPWIRDIKNIKTFFISKTAVSEYPQATNYRPVLMTTYALNYAWGGLNPFSFHLVNLLLHILTILGCFSLIYFVLNKNLLAAFWGAVLFAIHPINAEAVNYITARSSILSSLFSIGSILFYYLFRCKESDGRLLGSFWLYGLSLVSFILAVLSKETALILPGLLLIVDLTFKTSPPYSSWRKVLVIYIPWIGVLLGYWWIKRHIQVEVIIPDDSPIGSSGPSIGMISGTLTWIKIVVSYLLLLLWPTNLSIEHHLMRVLSPFEVSTIMFLAAFALLLLVIVRCWRPYRVVCFCLILFLVSLLPVFFITFVTNVALMQENRGYLAAVGIMMLAGWAISVFLEKGRAGHKPVGIVMITLLCITYIYLAIQRNQVWQDHFSLWSDAVQKAPGSPTPHLNLAVAQYRKGNVSSAMQELQRTLQLAPQDGRAHHVLGGIYLEQGKLDQAAKAYDLSVKFSPQNWKTYANLGSVLYKQGHTELAIKRFRQALEMNPGDWLTHYNLVTAYARQQKIPIILAEYSSAAQQNPGLYYNHYGLAVAYELMGEYKQAIEAYHKAIQVYPKFMEGFIRLCRLNMLTKQYIVARDQCMASLAIDANDEAHFLLGLIAEQMNDLQRAIFHYNESLRVKSNNLKVYFNLGNVYRQVGQLQEAVSAYQAAIRLNSEFLPARYNLARLLEEQNQFEEAIEQYQQIADRTKSGIDDPMAFLARERLQGLSNSLQSKDRK